MSGIIKNEKKKIINNLARNDMHFFRNCTKQKGDVAWNEAAPNDGAIFLNRKYIDK